MSNLQIDKKLIYQWLALILVLEVASYLGFVYPVLQNFFTLILLVVFGWLSLIDLRYGIVFIFAELLLGVQGYLFFVDLDGLIVSLRMLIYILWFSIWSVRSWFEYREKLFNTIFNYRREILALFFLLLLGVINGWLSGQPPANIFFDANGWFYWLYFLPFMMLVVSWKTMINFFLAAIAWLSLKTIVLTYIFSHSFESVQWWLYHWLRDFRLAEITPIVASLFRIFFQNQVFLIIILVWLSLELLRKQTFKNEVKLYFSLFLTASAFFISFSRSFWLGLFLAIFCWLALFIGRNYFKVFSLHFKKIILVFLFGIFGSIGLIFITVNFPYPAGGATEFSQLLFTRFTKGLGEAAAGSRLQMLKPLKNSISESWIIGQGFGKTISYYSADPRIIAGSPGGTGLYETYALEWGYLDIWLKLGLIGSLIYLLVLVRFWYGVWKKALGKQDLFLLSLAISLAALYFLNITTPYLNHPLGIGYVLLVLVLTNSYLYGQGESTKT